MKGLQQLPIDVQAYITLALLHTVYEILKMYCKPEMTTLWFIKRYMRFDEGFWTNDPIPVSFNRNISSTTHRFRDTWSRHRWFDQKQTWKGLFNPGIWYQRWNRSIRNWNFGKWWILALLALFRLLSKIVNALASWQWLAILIRPKHVNGEECLGLYLYHEKLLKTPTTCR